MRAIDELVGAILAAIEAGRVDERMALGCNEGGAVEVEEGVHLLALLREPESGQLP
jgi:hypothetical protein